MRAAKLEKNEVRKRTRYHQLYPTLHSWILHFPISLITQVSCLDSRVCFIFGEKVGVIVNKFLQFYW